MKKILLGTIIAVNLLAGEPTQYGAYYGNLKVSMKNYNNYPSSNASSAGYVYLYKQNKNDVDYIVETKTSHIKAGLSEAKKLAVENQNKYFAIDNVTHQVIATENKVIVLTNYNVLSFD
jgi:hypothetical protein